MKPKNLKDLLAGGHITKSEIRKIARTIFDGSTTAAGPEGYVITAAKFEDLSDACQQYIVKSILEFKVENVFDKKSDGLFMDSDDTLPEPVESDETY
jgi:hypothetical protein